MESESNSIEVVPTNQNIGESGDVMVGIEGGSLAKNGENDIDVSNIIVKEDIANVIPNEAVPDNDAGKVDKVCSYSRLRKKRSPTFITGSVKSNWVF